MPTNTNFLTAKEASELLKLAVKTLAMMRSDGTGPKFLKPSGKILYRLEDLEEWAINKGKFLSSQQANLLSKRFKRVRKHTYLKEK
ncbi:MAG: helix-turn-helix domain-containing protein, partial [Candidatus Caenarcaniphilales bacterium]|nr:helix-turn-helix domain-containing protein [Candidatus Caenarcaniphilales bacterium]